jgi:hypothetical protein
VWDTICKISGIPYFDEDAPVEAWSNFGCGFFKQKTGIMLLTVSILQA